MCNLNTKLLLKRRLFILRMTEYLENMESCTKGGNVIFSSRAIPIQC